MSCCGELPFRDVNSRGIPLSPLFVAPQRSQTDARILRSL